MEKITLTTEDREAVELYVLEQTTVGGRDYYLVTEKEDGDADAYIVKDLSEKDAEEAVFEFVEEETELQAVASVFENILGDDVRLEADGAEE